MEHTEYEKLHTGLLTLIAAFLAVFAVWVYHDFDKRMTQFSCDTAPQEVYEGTTVWELVMQNCTGNHSVAVDANVEVYGTNLQIGQIIYLVPNQDCTLQVTDGGEVTQNCK